MKIELETKDGRVQEFDKDHAERILRKENSGWSIAKGSKYQYSKKNGIISRRGKETLRDA